MTPVLQTSFYDAEAKPEHQRGNCFTAVVASFLDLPIEEVPNFVQDHVDHMDENQLAGEWDWWHRAHLFIESHGKRMAYIYPVENPEFTALEENWFRRPQPGEYYAVGGISPRDPQIHHVVIYQDGKMTHDPHPDGTGLVSVDDTYHWTLEEIEA